MDMPCLRKWSIRTNLQIETHLFARHQNVTLQVLKLYMSLHFFLLVHIFLGCKFNCTFLNYLGKLFGITRERWSMILLRLIGDLFKLSGLNNVTFNFYVPGWKKLISWSSRWICRWAHVRIFSGLPAVDGLKNIRFRVRNPTGTSLML